MIGAALPLSPPGLAAGRRGVPRRRKEGRSVLVWEVVDVVQSGCRDSEPVKLSPVWATRGPGHRR
jgi:hypothetical protein